MTDASLGQYAADLSLTYRPFPELESYASDSRIPIIHADAMAHIQQLITLHSSLKILEIGTAIGYSAMMMARMSPQIHVVTIERDEEMASAARHNIRKYGYQTQVEVMHGDALKLHQEVGCMAPFDLLFIDAAKGQYGSFFDLYTPMIKAGGLVITDNVFFRGFVTQADEDIPKRFRRIVHKLRTFNQELSLNPYYQTVFLTVGDGLAVSLKLGKDFRT